MLRGSLLPRPLSSFHHAKTTTGRWNDQEATRDARKLTRKLYQCTFTGRYPTVPFVCETCSQRRGRGKTSHETRASRSRLRTVLVKVPSVIMQIFDHLPRPISSRSFSVDVLQRTESSCVQLATFCAVPSWIFQLELVRGSTLSPASPAFDWPISGCAPAQLLEALVWDYKWYCSRPI